ncbi:hypothetical protein [Burkholderia vietnamiensis]|jgi:hypothetical protein|uniref:Uncharacterized protein n=1 Tax=Burkholderia vietnamiensis TaxID=60552 RepID=A0AAW7SUI4_BURVI|nr:hypothetical protein [Burkholderia vietnamiensis]MDN7793537.1 hypothetical protein [Burkholderia vietnamiensis]HDR8965221.1 hypothetical protein [Burkholderia vietnamiensis]HDR9072883.1 hypothetical protein [Burkholderia vietnamiensis]HDR9186734.1 hypothetical protein [Burkholderia vietnamiensis]HDR9358021.1 hypothetical protein [Burkholderia vietnamiensis]
MKSAYALLRKGKIYVRSYSQTTTGLWIGWGQVYVVDENNSLELAERVRDALNNSSHGVKHPSQTEWKAVQAPMLEAAGVKSWKTLAKGAKAIGLESDGSIVKIEPSSDYENSGGTGMPAQAIECEIGSSELGEALMRAFQVCS